MIEYRQMRKHMKSQADYDVVLAFEEECDVYTKVFTENGKDGAKGFIDDEAAFTTDEDENFFNSLF